MKYITLILLTLCSFTSNSITSQPLKQNSPYFKQGKSAGDKLHTELIYLINTDLLKNAQKRLVKVDSLWADMLKPFEDARVKKKLVRLKEFLKGFETGLKQSTIKAHIKKIKSTDDKTKIRCKMAERVLFHIQQVQLAGSKAQRASDLVTRVEGVSNQIMDDLFPLVIEYVSLSPQNLKQAKALLKKAPSLELKTQQAKELAGNRAITT
jgi:hypothetical protein